STTASLAAATCAASEVTTRSCSRDPRAGSAFPDRSPILTVRFVRGDAIAFVAEVDVVVTGARFMAIAESLAADAGTRFATSVTVVGEPTTAGEGMDNEIVFVQLAGDGLPAAWRGPLVVRVQPDANRYDVAEAEVAVQRWCQ